MKSRFAILILLIVVIPLALMTWAVSRMASGEQAQVRQQFRNLMEDRLRDINGGMVRWFEETERDMQRITAIDEYDVEMLRDLNRAEPRVLQLFVLTNQGNILYPNPAGSLNSTERSFLIRASKMFTGQDLQNEILQREAIGESNDAQALRPASGLPGLPFLPGSRRTPGDIQFPNDAQQQTTIQLSTDAQQQVGGQQRGSFQQQVELRQAPALSQETESSDQQLSQAPVNLTDNLMPFAAEPQVRFSESSGWFSWYWDRGVNLIYWQRRSDGHIVGAALERARWMADLIAELPDTAAFDATQAGSKSSSSPANTSRIRLVNSASDLVYQWGALETGDEQAEPFCEIPVTAPLSSWRLQCFVASEQIDGAGRSAHASLLIGLVAVGLGLVSMAWTLYRDYARGMNEAAQQVSFVNQVSHELKTPLTNIRMYAELLESDLEGLSEESSEQPRKRLAVIVSEGQRLSRLIGNVLTFARQKRRTLQPRPQLCIPDEVVRRIAERFRPALMRADIEMELETNADCEAWLDTEFFEQILGNLISNVEKYAADGKWMKIRTECRDARLVVEVCDAGPGISKDQWHRVFQPFSRLTDSISHPTGTGIGLSITRNLAQLHGGDIELVACNTGCCFRVMVDVSRHARSDS